MRLLQCLDCKTVDELPDFHGVPEDDVLLIHLVKERHTGPRRDVRGDPVDAAPGELHRGNLHNVDDLTWAHEKDNILKEMWSAFTGFEPEYYAARSTFHEDAIRCFDAHRRTVPCIDWHSDKKRIGNPVREQFKNPKAAVYLCDFCPVASEVMTEQRARRGDYK